MASTYTDLGVELMVTGENAGTWGTKTNTNLNLIEQISGGYAIQTLNAAGAGANTTTLSKSDGALDATVASRVIILGAVSAQAITGNKIVTMPVLTENFYLIKNSTSGSYTVQLKAASGSGATVTWAADEKDWRIVFFDGVATNTGVYDTGFGAATAAAGSNTQIQYNNSGAFGGDADLIWTAGTGLTINSQKELRLADTDDSAYIGMKAAGTTTSYTLTMPAAVATSNDQILTSTTGGVLSWVDNSGGTAWQAVVTGTTQTAVAGNGYFIDTTSNVCNVTLPAGTLGDEVSLVDYAGTFDSNTLTVTPASGEKIQGGSADAVLTSSTERSAFTLAYSGATQGWLLKSK
jgi:hypothetical protein